MSGKTLTSIWDCPSCTAFIRYNIMHCLSLYLHVTLCLSHPPALSLPVALSLTPFFIFISVSHPLFSFAHSFCFSHSFTHSLSLSLSNSPSPFISPSTSSFLTWHGDSHWRMLGTVLSFWRTKWENPSRTKRGSGSAISWIIGIWDLNRTDTR